MPKLAIVRGIAVALLAVAAGCASRQSESVQDWPVIPIQPGARYSAIQVAWQSPAPTLPEVGKPAPDWQLPDVNGKTVSLADYRGKSGVLLVFFATWCPHCMKEVPLLISFQNKYQKAGVEVVGVAVEQSAATIRRFAEQRKVNYTLLIDERGQVAKRYGVIGVPTNVGIDAAGVIRYLDNPSPEDLDKLAKQLQPKK